MLVARYFCNHMALAPSQTRVSKHIQLASHHIRMAMCLGGQNVGNEEIRDDVNVHFASEVLVGVGGKKLGIDPTHIKSSQQE